MNEDQIRILRKHVPNTNGPLDDMSCDCGWVPALEVPWTSEGEREQWIDHIAYEMRDL